MYLLGYYISIQAKRVAASPGGLDPQEVYEKLPEEMRVAFDSQDVSRLQDVATTMDKEVVLFIYSCW